MATAEAADTMKLAGFQGTTLIDYPGRVATTLFAVGCNYRCPFCHNAELVLPDQVDGLDLLDPEDVIRQLARRSGFLDAVVLTGGEPTLQPDLVVYIGRIRDLDLLVKLDTNGSDPSTLRALLDLGVLDYVAVDIKGPPERYAEFGGPAADPNAVAETISLLRRSDIDYELRTTVAPGLAAADIEEIASWIAPAKRYVLQAFRVPGDEGKRLLDPSWAKRPALEETEIRSAWEGVRDRFEDGGVRA